MGSIFDELESYVRPTDRGRAALLSAIELLRSQQDADMAALERLKNRLSDRDSEDPIFIEDVRAAFDKSLRLAEDVLDDEDADRLLLSGAERVEWSQVRDELT